MRAQSSAEAPDAWMAWIDADLAQVALEGIFRIDPLELIHDFGEPIDLASLERKRFANFACRAAAAVGNHVGGHRRAVLAVLLIDVLDHAFPAIAAREIEIDVRPFAPFFRQEPLEQQFHSHRIHGGDAKAVANGAIGGRTTPLYEDVLLPAKVDDVPDDEEIPSEIELLDQIQLTRNLRACPIVIRPVALARAGLRDLS